LTSPCCPHLAVRLHIAVDGKPRTNNHRSHMSTWSVHAPILKARTCKDKNGFGFFFGIPKISFEIFQLDSPVAVFFENGISFRNFLSELVSKSAWCFTDRFLRLPVFVGNYRICVLEFSGIVTRIFFRIFQHVIFSHRMYVSG
jgi:hypothetical protein